MKRDEFREFHESFLFARFPELESWLNGMSEDRRAETLESWFEVLRHAELPHAQEAVRRLHAGDEPEPRSFSKFPASILAIARKVDRETPKADRHARHGPKLVDGEWVFECLQCRDHGAVECWHPASLEDLAAELQDPARPRIGATVTAGEDLFGRPKIVRLAAYSCFVACTCAAGATYRRAKVRALDAERDLALWRRDADGEWRLHWQTDPEEIEAARAFVAALLEKHQGAMAGAADPQQEIPF